MSKNRPLDVQKYWRYLPATGVFILVCLLAGVSLYWQVSRELEQGARVRLALAVARIDELTENARRAAEGVAENAGAPCIPDVQEALRYQVAILPDVRTVSLVRDGVIYCSSLYNRGVAFQDSSSGGVFVNGMLMLLRGNHLTPGRSVLIYRESRDRQNAVHVGIDGYYLHNILLLLSIPTPLIFSVGNTSMDEYGRVADLPSAPEGKYYQLTSARFPYTVSTVISDRVTLSLIREFSSGIVVLFVLMAFLLSVLTGRVTRWLMSPEQRLRDALRRRQFVPWLQQVVTPDGQLAGCEVLIRWVHPVQGILSPYTFILQAENSGLIIPMTRELMRQVRERFSGCYACLPQGFHFAFNVTADYITRQALVEECRSFLAAFPPGRINLVLEVTERQEIIMNEQSQGVLHQLRELGVLMAIDDFGTGHSSLAYLKEQSFDLIKLDQSFIRNIVTGEHSRYIVRNVAELAGQLNMKTQAEGVETEDQLSILREYQIDYIQGYLFGRPTDMDTFIQSWLKE